MALGLPGVPGICTVALDFVSNTGRSEILSKL